MEISAPCIITSRLMAGIKIGNGTISIGYADREGDDNRIRYQWYIDIDGAEYSSDDLQSGNPVRGCNNGIQSGLASLLSFLGAAAESYAYDIRRGGDGTKGENSELFPLPVVQWAHMNSDEITMYSMELDEGDEVIAE